MQTITQSDLLAFYDNDPLGLTLIRQLQICCINYSRHMRPEELAVALELYTTHIADNGYYDAKQVEAAFYRHMASCQFFPTVAEILKIINEDLEEQENKQKRQLKEQAQPDKKTPGMGQKMYEKFRAKIIEFSAPNQVGESRAVRDDCAKQPECLQTGQALPDQKKPGCKPGIPLPLNPTSQNPEGQQS